MYEKVNKPVAYVANTRLLEHENKKFHKLAFVLITKKIFNGKKLSICFHQVFTVKTTAVDGITQTTTITIKIIQYLVITC